MAGGETPAVLVGLMTVGGLERLHPALGDLAKAVERPPPEALAAKRRTVTHAMGGQARTHVGPERAPDRPPVGDYGLAA